MIARITRAVRAIDEELRVSKILYRLTDGKCLTHWNSLDDVELYEGWIMKEYLEHQRNWRYLD
jgi:hypothetical protein